MKIHKTSLITGVGFAAALMLGACAPDAPEAAAAADQAGERSEAATTSAAASMETVTLKVEGMTCGGCAVGARTALGRLDGVEKADVSYEEQLAVVVHDPAKVTVEKMAEAVAELGFEATLREGG